ncbi:MAG: tRNA uridine-5-carboxymethylaminomethyl(34) synthesis enzyme MnmG, partial [Deltaproteobacteria bacterium]|nr:tRNA uridine-5-carboxymethylaminomethyl(34) synthesis enzyme MnmG [Deltaproteobacteria bacterium]
KTLETQPIPEDFDFTRVHGLSNELKQKLSAVMPVSLGQASRVDGMTPSALSVLMIAIRAGKYRNDASRAPSEKAHSP